jgi:hypothetical protein
MPTKADLLSKFDEGSLKKIAKGEGYPIPKTFGKPELVKYLEGMLTLEKIKEYTAEVYENETKREIIRETVKERGVRVKVLETERIEITKPQLVTEIMNYNNQEKIHKLVLQQIGNTLHQPIPKGTGFNLYHNMSDPMLQTVHSIFVKRESDKEGRNLEVQFANFLMNQTDLDIKRLEIRYKLSDTIGEIDIVGFDDKNKPVLMAESKDRQVKWEDMDKWIGNIRRIYTDLGGSLKEAYFIGSNGYSKEIIKRLESTLISTLKRAS